MFKSLSNLFKRKHREFDSFQVEISSYSSMECQLCPQAVFAEHWVFQNMSLETFQKIGPYLPLARRVDLHGWGDPLANDNVVQMVHMAKEAGCSTGLTTRGLHLTEDISQNLLTESLDFLEVPLEEIPRPDREALSTGTDLGQILDNLQGFSDLKRRSGRKNPTLRLSFLMTRMNIREFPHTISLAARLGADEVVLRNLDYLPEKRWNILRTFHHESPTPAFQESITETHRLGKKMGIRVTSYPLKAEEVPVCEPNPPQNVFFSVDGSAAPCMYLRLPKEGEISRTFLNDRYTVPQTSFGNINREGFWEIWNKEAYRNFRKIFEDRLRASVDMMQILDDIAQGNLLAAEEEVPPPPPLSPLCRTCYKAYGI
jgi:MoaA/NifB/PqqE/SkfB family radical SAM enzyme